MDVKQRNDDEPHHEDNSSTIPLLETSQSSGSVAVAVAVERSRTQGAISQTFKCTAHLAKLLPRGTVMASQFLSPIFTDNGQCSSASRALTTAMVTLCGLSVFLLSFTDSFTDVDGNVYHGFATFRGLWVIDGSTELPQQLADEYRVRFIDFVHAFMSLLVFAAVTLFDRNIVRCFYPDPSMDAEKLLVAVPIGIGVVGSALFVVFPTTRNGIGYSISSSTSK